jgi:DNA excision repair protein ERCC-4
VKDSPFVIVIDTREPPHTAWTFEGIPTVRRCLRAGDYSVEGLEDRVSIERKEAGDLVATLTFGRERFERELEILATYDRAAIVIEGDLESIIEWKYRSSVSPAALVGSFASIWARYGVPVVFAGSRRNAQILVGRMLAKAAKHLRIESAA